MFDRISWQLWRRALAGWRFKGLIVSPLSSVDTKSTLSPHVALHGAARVRNSNIGRYSYINSAMVSNTNLGSFCSIGPGAFVGGLGAHPTGYISTHPAFYSNSGQVSSSFVQGNLFDEHALTVVGEDVWIGANAIVLDGVKIGTGCVIGAGAVVTKDMPPYSICTGVPARVRRQRFSDSEVAQLLSSEWWKMSDENLGQLAKTMRSGDVSELTRQICLINGLPNYGSE